jgi:MFS family permease
VCTSFAFASYSLFLPAFLAEFHWARGAAALPFSLAMVCWGAMQPVAGAFADRWGTRPVILVGILVIALGFCTMGTAQSLWQVALGFGVLLGTATSACGSLMGAADREVVPRRAAPAVGILQAATPMSPLVLAPSCSSS